MRVDLGLFLIKYDLNINLECFTRIFHNFSNLKKENRTYFVS